LASATKNSTRISLPVVGSVSRLKTHAGNG
jgi:hypothetical protein